MEQRPLGRTNLTLSAIGLGCVTFGREIDEESSYRVLDYALKKGITWFDTAEAYGGGNARKYRKEQLGVEDIRETSGEMGSSECILGRWIRSRGCRGDITICTKVSSGNSPENIRKAMAASLERLGGEAIDIYELHSWDPDVPIAESLDVLTEEVKSGHIQVIGCSNLSGTQLHEAIDACAAHGYSRIEVVQPPYSLAAPGAEEDLFPLCRKERIGVTTYSPLAAGFLTGKYTPDRSSFPEGSRFHIIPAHADIYFSGRNFRLVEQLRDKADELGLPPVRLAMAWAMSHPDVTSVLVGARKTEHIDNALAAFEMKLDPDLREQMSSWG